MPQVVGVEPQVLRGLVIAVARAILEGQKWPPEVKKPDGLYVWFGYTPHRKFKVCHITPSRDTSTWRVTVLESNPAKVINARDKVMVYFERPTGRRVRTGQVRRQDGRYNLIWFDS